MQEKGILITGASSGIGLMVSKFLVSSGYIVFAASRHVTTGMVQNGMIHLKMDVTDEASVNQAVDFIKKQGKPLHAVINSAGLGMTGAVEFTSDKEARLLFDTNVFGVLNVCRATLPLLRENCDGYIINITSMAAQIALPFRGLYSSSKFAVEGFSESLSQEVRQFGIKVVLVEPGDFKTGINKHRLRVSADDTSEYGDLHNRILKQVNQEVDGAPTPEIIGRKIVGILKNPNPKLRYRIASPKVRLSYRLMRILPSRVFESILRKYYRLP